MTIGITLVRRATKWLIVTGVVTKEGSDDGAQQAPFPAPKAKPLMGKLGLLALDAAEGTVRLLHLSQEDLHAVIPAIKSNGGLGLAEVGLREFEELPTASLMLHAPDISARTAPLIRVRTR